MIPVKNKTSRAPRKFGLSSNALMAAINIAAMTLIAVFIILAYSILTTRFTKENIGNTVRFQLDSYANTLLDSTFGVAKDALDEFLALVRSDTVLTKQANIMDLLSFQCQRIKTDPRGALNFIEVFYPKNGWGAFCTGTSKATYTYRLSGFADPGNTSVFSQRVRSKIVNGTVVYTYSSTTTVDVRMVWRQNSSYQGGEDASQETSETAIALWGLACSKFPNNWTCPDNTLITGTSVGGVVTASSASSLSAVLNRTLALEFDGVKAFVVRSGRVLIAASDSDPRIYDPVAKKTTYPYWTDYVNDSTISTVANKILLATSGQRLDMVEIGDLLVSSAHIPVGNQGAYWTLFVSVPRKSVYGRLETITWVCVGIAVGITLAMVIASWALSYFLVSRPLTQACSMLATASTLNIDEIAAKSGVKMNVIARVGDRIVATPQARSNAPKRSSQYLSVSDVGAVEDACSRLMDTLLIVSRYVSHELMVKAMNERLLSCPLSKMDITVLFCDLEGSTTALDRCEADGKLKDFTSMLNELLRELAKTAQDMAGYVDKLMGDAVMVLFGAVNQGPGHQEAACRAAVALNERVKRLYEMWDREGAYVDIPRLKVRIGICSGSAFVGDLGSSDTLISFSAIGSSVCVASRIEHSCKWVRPTSLILLTGETWNAACNRGQLDEEFLSHAIGPSRIRGRKDLVQLYTIIGHKGDVSEILATNAQTFDCAIAAFRAGDYSACVNQISKLQDGFMPEASRHVLATCHRLMEEEAKGEKPVPPNEVALYDLSEEHVLAIA